MKKKSFEKRSFLFQMKKKKKMALTRDDTVRERGNVL